METRKPQNMFQQVDLKKQNRENYEEYYCKNKENRK